VRAVWSSVLLAVATAVAGCGGNGDGESTPTAEARDCPAELVWEDNDYRGSDVRLPAGRGEELGEATVPACGARQERRVQVARIPGIDPSVAVSSAEDAFTVWVAEDARAQDYPEPLDRILYGLSCEEKGPFTLTGRLVAVSDRDEPLYVQLDVDGGVGAYEGAVIDLAVRDTTEGMNSRAGLSERRPGKARLRARVRCVDADQPNRTFLAESIEATSGG
jgi:hypothetical protein